MLYSFLRPYDFMCVLMLEFDIVLVRALFEFHHLDLTFIFIFVVHLLWWVLCLHSGAGLLPMNWCLGAWNGIFSNAYIGLLLLHIVVNPWTQLLLVHILQFLQLLCEALLISIINIDINVYIPMIYEYLLLLCITTSRVLLRRRMVECFKQVSCLGWKVSKRLDDLLLALLPVVVRWLRSVDVLGAVISLTRTARDPRKIILKFTNNLLWIFIWIDIFEIH